MNLGQLDTILFNSAFDSIHLKSQCQILGGKRPWIKLVSKGTKKVTCAFFSFGIDDNLKMSDLPAFK